MRVGWEDEAENWVRWARTPGHDVYKLYSPAFFEDLVPKTTGPILEIGCGEGRVVRDLIERGYSVVGLDPSPTLISYARGADVRSSYVIAQGEALPFSDNSFEIVVAYNSLQNVNDLSQVVAEAARVLAPTGRLCVCVVHPMVDFPNRFESKDPSAPFVVTSYYGPRWVDDTVERAGIQMTFTGWAYSLEEYMRAFEDSGLVIELMREPRLANAPPERPSLERWRRLPMFLFVRALKR
jgi:ubiquinone/menaquinone biosynthesis C-methylase UbiE